jgi:hypothetical protein
MVAGAASQKPPTVRALVALTVLTLALTVAPAHARACHSSCVSDGKKVTLAGGTAPDGSRYEWIGFTRRATFYAEGRWERMYCVVLRVGSRTPAGGSCWGPGERMYPDAAFAGGPGAFPYQRGFARPDVLIEGMTDDDVASVRVVYSDLAGDRHELPVNYTRVAHRRLPGGSSRRARRSVRGIDGFGLFAAFVPADWVARDRLFARERELRGTDPSVPPGDGPLDLGDLMYRSVFSACPGRPAGPFEFRAYDAARNELPVMPRAACPSMRASAAQLTPGQAVRDCTVDGDLDRDYPTSVLRRALDLIPADADEYSDCADVIRTAMLDAAAAGGGGGSGGTDANGAAVATSADGGRPDGGARTGEGGDATLGGNEIGDGRSPDERRSVAASEAGAAGLPWGWLLAGALVALALILYLLSDRIAPLWRGLTGHMKRRLAPDRGD